MPLKLRLYNTDSPSNKINKSLENPTMYTIDFKNKPKDFNKLDIDFTGDTRITPFNYNYAYLPRYELYYFVKMLPSNIGNNHNILHLELDPLMTYKSQILGLNVITKRNTNNYNVYLNDENQKITEQTKQFYHTFKGGDISYFKPHKSILLTLVGSS